MKTRIPKQVLPVLVLAQFAGTSLWFAINAVMPDLQAAYGWPQTWVAHATGALQIGFVAGTLVFAAWGLADRFDPVHVFVWSCVAGAVFTALAGWSAHVPAWSLAFRLASGVSLAGIYPVGMKIAALWYRQGLGLALGWLVGALILGSAAPHGIRALGHAWPWQGVFGVVVILVLAGGVLMYTAMPRPARLNGFVPLRPGALWAVFMQPRLKASVLGYWGHMWELYAMWVLMPWIIATRLDSPSAVSGMSFCVLGLGTLGCVGGGYAAQRWGSARVASACLATSGVCALTAPLWWHAADIVFFGVLMLWGLSVTGDSPQFSALTAQAAPADRVGSVLTMANSVGFVISTLTIYAAVASAQSWGLMQTLPCLALGPALGVWAMRTLWRQAPTDIVSPP